MSYATKYTLECIDYFGQSAELLIEEQDYGGSSSDIKGTSSPITITYDTPSDFLLEPINGSSLTMRLISQTDFQFLDLYTANNRKYRVTLNVSSSLFWRGYILPDQYQEEYKGPPYVCEFVATDQLGYLKTQAWTNTSTLSELDAFDIIFGATDLELDLYEGLNIYEDNHDQTAADSPLDQTFFDGDNFTDSTYYDVLYQILFKYCAVLKQKSGEWYIFRPRESFQAYTVRKWAWNGSFSYDLNTSYNPVILTTSATVAEASLVRISGGTMFNNPAWKEFTLIHNMGLRESFIPNYDFSHGWTDNIPDNWWPVDITTNLSYSRIGNSLRIQAQAYNPSMPIDYFYYALNFDDTSIYQVIDLAFDFDVFVGIGDDLTVYIEVFFNNPGIQWFDPDSASWSGTQKFITKTYDNSGGSEVIQVNEKLNFTSPRITGFSPTGLFIRLYAPIYTSGSTQDSVKFNEARLTLMSRPTSGVVKDFDAETDYSGEVDLNNNYTPEDMEVMIADAPTASYPNADAIWDGILYLNSSKISNTHDWSADGRSATLMELMQQVFNDLFQYPQQVLSVRIYSKLIDSCTILQEINNTTTSQNMFMIKRADYEQKEGYWEVEAHQLPFAIAGSDEKVLITEDEKLITTEDDKRIIIE